MEEAVFQNRKKRVRLGFLDLASDFSCHQETKPDGAKGDAAH
jgi:hypothetical protein